MQQVVGKTMIRWLQEFGDKESNSEAVDFFYPSAPLPANPDDPSKETSNLRAWGHGDPEQDQINGLENSLQFISKILEENGPFIGIVGFSTGAAVAALISSLLEKKESASGFRSSVRIPKPDVLFGSLK
jgi:predicted esterase